MNSDVAYVSIILCLHGNTLEESYQVVYQAVYQIVYQIVYHVVRAFGEFC
jgi:hypothetical protein